MVVDELLVCLDCSKLIETTVVSEYLIVGTHRHGDIITLGTFSKEALTHARQKYRCASKYVSDPGNERVWRKLALIKRTTVLTEIPLESVEIIS